MRGGSPASLLGSRFVLRGDTKETHSWKNGDFNGTRMCQYLPTDTFVETEVTESNRVTKTKSKLDIEDNHKHGYFIECDLGKPSDLHENLNILHFLQKRKQSNWNILHNKWKKSPMK